MMRQLYFAHVRKYFIGLIIIISCLFAATTAQAVSLWWDGTTSVWSTAANWSTVSGATTPDPAAVPGASDDAIFNITTANGNETVSLGTANQSANSLTFNNAGTTTLNAGGTNRTLTLGTGGITVNPGAGAVSLGNSGSGQNVNIYLNGSQTWVNNSSNTLNINNTIFTPGGVTQTLTFDGSANITSITAISSSILSPLSIVKNGANTVQLSFTGTSTSNLYAGTLTVNSGTFNIGGGDMYVGGLAGSGTVGIGISQSKWFRDYQSGNSTFSGVLQNGGGTLGLYKDAAGTLTLNGSVVNTCTGTTTSQGGTLILDFTNLATPTNLVNSTSGLSLTGGNLTIKGNSSGATSQTFNGLSLGTDSYSSITLNPNGGSSTTLSLGAVPLVTASASTGSNYGRRDLLVDISSAAGGTMNVATSTANGTQLPYAVVKDAAAGSVDMGIVSGGNVVRMSAWTPLPISGAGSTSTDYNVTANWTKTDTTPQSAGTLTVDSSGGNVALNLNTAALTVSNSGLLTRGANTVTFSNGTIGNTTGELYFHIYAPTTVSTSFGTSGSPAGFNFIKDGTGTLTFNPSTASYLSGRMQIHAGTMVINNASLSVASQDTWVGSQGNATATLTLSGSTAYTTMSSATAGMSVTVGDGAGSTGVLNIQDTASLTALNLYVGGANGQNYSGNGTVNQSTSGTVTVGLTTASNFAIGGRSSSSTLGVGTYNLTGGTLHVLSGAVPYIGRYGTGKLKIGPGATVNFDTTSSGVVGGNTGVGLIDMTGGNLTTSGELRVGTTDTSGAGYNAVGTINISGGTATISSLTLARGNNNQSTTTGNLNVSNGATLNNVNDLILGYAGSNDLGKMTIADSGTTVNVGPSATKWFILGEYDTSKGELDISGGALNLDNSTCIKFSSGNNGPNTVNVINQSGGTVTFYSDAGFTAGGAGDIDLSLGGALNSNNTYNLNGGTLIVPKIDSTTNNGARAFNFNGGTLTAAAGDTIGPPFVAFMNLGSGGTGTAVANVRNNGAIIDSNTYNITIATPLTHSIIAGDNAIDGGLKKQGLGVLTLPGSNNYTGPTTVNGGTLSVTGSINASNVTVNSGTLDGTGTITNGVTIVNNASNILTNGNGGSGTLSLLSSLAFQGAAGFNPRLVQAAPAVPGVAVTGVLSTTPASGTVTVTPITSSGSWNNGIYTLLTFGSDPGVLLTNFTLVPVTGLSPRQSAAAPPSLILTASSLQLKINGTAITWTGLDNNKWAVGLNGVNKNWQYTGIKTDYLEGDIVVFDDTVGAGPTAIDLGTSVVPGNMTFNNSAVDYSISSVGFNGILSSSGAVVSSLTKSGTRSLTISTYDDYRGGTFFNGGTLNIGYSNALGTGPFTVGTGNPKTLDNTDISSTSLLGVTSQAWNDDFTFAGTNSMDMGGAPVTLGGGGAARTVTVNNGSTLTVGRIGSATGSGIGLTVSTAGTGTLAVNTTYNSVNGNSSIDGTLTVNTNATLQINTGTDATSTADFIATGLAGGGTIVNGGGVEHSLIINSAAATTFSGLLTDGSGGGKLDLNKGGAGTLTLTNGNTYTGQTTVNSGTIVVENASALSTGNIQFPNASTGTLDIALDLPTTLANTFGTNTTSNITLLSDRATPGLGVTHGLSGNGATGGMGGGTVTIAAGPNVVGGNPAIALGDIRLTAGYDNTTTFIPTTAAVTIASVTNGSGNTHTLELGGTGSGSILGDITVTSGTLNLLKSNTSTWTLLGNSNYNGTTIINSGVLNIGNGSTTGTLIGGAVTNNAILNFNRSNTIVVSSTITGTGAINQNGGGAVVFTGTVGNPVNVNSGTLDGTGSIGATTVVNNPAVVVTNGNGGGGALTLASLTFNGSAALNVRASSPGLIVTGALKTRNVNPLGTVTLNPTPASGIWADGANDLIKYGAGSVFGLGGGDVILGAVGGTLGPRQAAGGLFLRDTNGDTINDTISLLINGDTPKWTGGVNNTWNTALNPPPRNWRLINAGTPTDFLTGDKVVFDDSATGPTAININAASVQVLNATFNNNTLNYAVSSTGGWGITNWGAVPATLTKNGSGSVTISTNNTFTGATAVNAGTLTLAGANTSPSTTVGSGGTLQLDFSAATAPVSDILANGSSLTLGCATLNVIANATAFSSQTMGTTTLNAGGAAINVTGDRSTNPTVLNLGSITKNPGGTAIFTLPTGTQDGANGVTTSNSWTNSLLGTWAMINSPGTPSNGGTGGYTYATLGGTSVTPYISATPENTSGGTWNGMPSGGDGTINYDMTIAVNNTSQGISRSFNSVRILAGGTQGGTVTNTMNGLMNAGSASFTLSSPVAIGSSNDLVLAAMAGPITLTNSITGSGQALTIVGPYPITLSGASTSVFTTYVSGGSKLVVTGSLAGPVVLDPSTLDGTGSVGAITAGVGSTIANGNGGAGTLTTAALTFQGAAAFNARLAAPATPAISVTGALATTPANGQVVVNAYGSGLTAGTYDLIGYGSTTASVGDFTPGPSLTSGRIVNGGLQLSGGNLWINVTGFDSPKWTGALAGKVWSTAIQAAPKNWKLINAGGQTDYYENDTVLFDNSAANYTVNVPANVNPSSVTFNNTSTYTVAGAGGVTGTATLTKTGAGTVNLNNVNSYSGATVVTDGTLAIGGTTSTTGLITVGNAAGGNPTLTVSGTLNANLTTRPSLIVGSTSGAAGALNVTTGGSLTTINELWLGAEAASNPSGGATVTMFVSGGSVSAGNWFVVGWGGGAAGNTATLTQTGGSIAVTNNRMTIANGSSNSIGDYYMSGGTFSGTVYVGEFGTGSLNVSGTALFNTDIGGVALPAVYIGYQSGSFGTVNLNGGTIATRWVGGGTGSSIFNFNGGTLQATQSDTTPNPTGQLFVTNTLSRANVRNGGAVVDTQAFSVTIAQALQHSNIGGDAAVDGGLTKNGVGTLILTAANTYTGPTTINDGLLQLASTGQINVASAISTAASTATLEVNGGTQTLGTIGGIGNLTLDAGTNLTATSVAQNTVTIGAGATLTIAAIPGGPSAGLGSISPVPEPSTWAMLMLAAMGLGIYWRRSR